MPSAADLQTAVTALETQVGPQTGNSSVEGLWLRFALAAEAGSGTTSSANTNITGSMQRAALALEVLAGTSPVPYNTAYSGLLQRIVNALEALGSTQTGSLANRFVTASGLAQFFASGYALAADYKLQRYRQTATRTNLIVNTAFAGVVGGGVPTGWTMSAAGGLTPTFANGTDARGSYVDVTVTGTPNATASVVFDNISIPVKSNASYTYAADLALSGGSLANTSVQIALRQGDSPSGGALVSSTTVNATVGSVPYRAVVSATTSATTQSVAPRVFINLSSGLPVNVTLRVYNPQFEQAPAPSAFIPNTSTVTGSSVSVTENKYVSGPVRTNLMLWSNDLTQSNWTKGASSVSFTLAVATPSGTPAAKLIEDNTNSTHNCTQGISGPSVGTYIFSFTAKAAERTTVYAQLSDNSTGGPNATFDLSAGTISASNNSGNWTGLLSQIIPLGNGFYRCIFGATKTAGANGTAQPNIFIRQAAAYLGDGTSGLYIADTQMEYSSSAITTATAYIGPTNASMNMCCAGGIADLYGFSYSGSGARGEVSSDGTIQYFPAGVPPITKDGYWSRAALTNLFLNSAVGVTQNITVTAQAYTLSFFGTGTITLSGVSTAGPLVGTGANNRVTLTFTPSTGTLTLTVSGSCTNVGMVVGTQPGPIIVTTTSTAIAGATTLSLNGAPGNVDWVSYVAVHFKDVASAGQSRSLTFSDGGNTNRVYLNRTSVGDVQANFYNGTQNPAPTVSAVQVGAGRCVMLMGYQGGGTFLDAVKDSSGTVTINRVTTSFSYPTFNRTDIGNQGGGNQPNAPVEFAGIKQFTASDTDLTNLLTSA